MNGPSTVLSGTFADRYTVERELGRGGSAIVYLARDLQRGHDVAIKVLREEFAETIGADRFLKEIRLSEQLLHPQIVPVLDSGKHDGRLYFVLPYMEGGTLRQRLDREKQLTLDDAIAITKSVASALAHAHEKGLIHRDVKPENILFTSGQACLADFGIARALERAMGETVTSTSIVRGTPHYMSPEQASGETQLDARSDIYSLGCVLYEMLAGIQPFVGPTPESVIAQRLTHPPRPLRMIRRSVPRSIERVIDRALLIARADRYQTADDFATALDVALQARDDEDDAPRRKRRLMFALGGGVAAIAVGVAILLRPEPLSTTEGGIPEGDPRRVAVLYLDDLTPDALPAHVADGLTEDLIDRLGGVSVLHVTSSHGVRPFRGTQVPLDSIGRALKVGTVVTGSAARSGNTIRVHVRLVDPVTGRQLHNETLEEPWTELFALQDKLASQVAFVLRQRLGNEVALREHRSATKSYEAWEIVQRAGAEVRRANSLSGDQQAQILLGADSLYARAERVDESWTLPTYRRGRIALLLSVQARKSPSPADSAAFGRLSFNERRLVWIQRALDFSNAALRRSPQSAEALSVRGEAFFRLMTAGTPGGDTLMKMAEQDLRSSVALRADGADAWSTLAQVLYSMGRFDEAAIAAQRAFEADAFFEVRRTVAVAFSAALYAGRFDDARRWCEFGLTHYPGDERFAECRVTLLGWSGRTRADVAQAWRHSNDLERLDTAGLHARTWAYRRLMIAATLARAGMRDSAKGLLEAVQARQRAPIGEAYVRLLLGDRDSALVHLGDYLKATPPARAQIAQHPWFSELKGDARFEALVRPAP